ncbi:MAG: 50S ribosomal protein L15 [Clostridia bacterium]|nr:50S ribosomal protein L15 [Clostridia bacterium]MBR3975804.1 50S ribosomal protein L15 [Clostridia bacterium]
MKIHELSPAPGSTKPVKRIGRGPASGQGKTAGKGHKGQKARAGRGMNPGFEGGQMPLQRRLPKRGFNNIFAKEIAIVNLSALEATFEDGAVIDAAALLSTGLVKKELDGIKVLAHGELTKKFTVKANAFSKEAKAKIEAVGGTAEVVE